MSVLSKQQVKSAAPRKCKMSLDSQHITSSDFLQLQPVYYRHMIPGEKISVNATAISRLAPLSVPTYGRANLNMRAFFVPYRTVNPTFNDFIADTIYSSGSTSSIPAGVPKLPNSVLRSHFTTPGYSTDYGTTILPGTAWDFKYNGHYFALTTAGRLQMKIINSLGYRVVWSNKEDFDYNALALLAYLRVYMDWYSLSQYLNSAACLSMQRILSYNDPSTPFVFTAVQLADLLNFTRYVAYDQDYFTSQWDNPVAPASSTYSSFNVSDITDPNTPAARITPASNGTVAATLNAQSPILTENTMHLLHALNNYMRGHQMAGARAIDRLLVDYGIQLRADKLNRSTYLGNSVIPIKIGDVTSTADTSAATDPSNLGDFAGRGVLQGQSNFDYESEEFGMFVICSCIVPAIGYVQGFDRNNLHLDKLDFFNGRFDNCGVQAAAKGELYVSSEDIFAPNATDYLTAMGFLPRYAEYKVGRDFLTGDFASDTALIGRNSWHLFRRFSDTYFGTISGVVHGIGLCSVGFDHADYDRIFQNTDSDVDHFYNFYNFEVTSYVPALPLYDTYVFENEEDKQTVTVEPNGSKLN